MEMGTPHKHAELIKAWADGTGIQYLTAHGDWIDAPDPCWTHLGFKFRIKPKEKPLVVRWLWADKDGYFPMRMLTEDEAENADGKLIKLEWSRTEFLE
jgi:hypothetical protein